ncbi:MAG: hypothetical protein U0797_03615 [Gemmataceae bacterium]
MRKPLLVLALAGLAGLALLATTLLPPRPKPRVVQDADLTKLFKPRMGAGLPRDAAFRDETGKRVTLGDYGNDRPFVLVPVYLRCPSLCNEVLNELVKALRGVATLDAGRHFDVVVVSFDAREGPELAAAEKAAYVEEYARRGSGGGWHFLTGEQPPIDRLLGAAPTTRRSGTTASSSSPTPRGWWSARRPAPWPGTSRGWTTGRCTCGWP